MSASAKREHGGEIITLQCGTIANWIGAQYHLLQNSNCDVHAPYQRSTHFRRTQGSSSSMGEWTPRVVSLDASVGLDGVVATYGAQEQSAASTQERALQQYRMDKQREAAASSAGGAGSASAPAAAMPQSSRPKHWTELSKNVYSYHSKSLYSMPGLYQGTSDFHLHEQGCELMSRESVHEEVLDRVRWFLEECDQPDGIHMLVEANSGWSGVGATLLGLLRDEYEKIPIFCVSALLPPPPSSLLGSTFASSTPLVQSVLNSSLLLNSATQLATAYLPLTSHYWAMSQAAQAAVPPQLHKAIQSGEVYETASLMALQMHFATSVYRTHPRTVNMASALAGVTQQSQANVLSSKLVTHLQLEEAQAHTAAAFNPQMSSSAGVARTPTVHTLPTAVPMSLIGHWHAYPPSRGTASLETLAAMGVPSEANGGVGAGAGSTDLCDRNSALTESLHAFGNTETLSHTQLMARLAAQAPALFRHVDGESRLNVPPSFPPTMHDLMTEGSATTLYRCHSAGDELRRLGMWLSSLNRGAVITSAYAQREEGVPLDSAPVFLLSAHRRARAPGDKTSERAEEFNLSFTQEQIDELTECGMSLQNLAELY